MQIEEAFRDLKRHRWGFGLRYARCHDAKRVQSSLRGRAEAVELSCRLE
jgi:hypothetical protein